MATKHDYIINHVKSGLKVGDRVKVLRLAKDHARGWGNSWKPEMNKYVGEEYVITKDWGSNGFELCVDSINESFDFPYFVLQKVEPKLEVSETVLCLINRIESDIAQLRKILIKD